MKFVIKLIALALFFLLPPQVSADSFENILRKTAIARGVLPSQNLYDNRDQSLVKLGKIFFNSFGIGALPVAGESLNRAK